MKPHFKRHRAPITDTMDAVCLSCYLLNGHIMVFTVPSLKPLIDVDFIPSPSVRCVVMMMIKSLFTIK